MSRWSRSPRNEPRRRARSGATLGQRLGAQFSSWSAAMTGTGATSGSRSEKVQYANSPLLAAKTPLWRSRLVVFGLGLAFLGLAGRAAWVQVINQPFYLKQGESRYVRKFVLSGERGRILDRNGQILAASVPSPSIWAIPKDFKATAAQRRELAQLLGYSVADLSSKVGADGSNFVWLRRQVDESTAAKVKALGLSGVHQQREFRREYPSGESSAHVVGFTNVENNGQEGVELIYQNALQGRNGSRSVVRDRLGRIVEDIGDAVDPQNGSDITLSLDSKVQYFAHQQAQEAVARHAAKAASVVVLDVLTGEILAMANAPSYVPDDRRGMTGEQVRNRAVTDTFEPGSTMKPFTIALSLQSGRSTPQRRMNTSGGRIVINGSTITDSHAHPSLTVEEVVQKSSNVGTVRLALEMPARDMWEMFDAIGLGQKPDLRFPGMAAGRLRPYRSWRTVEQATMSYGYGLSASLIQLARAYTVFARDGQMVPVTLLKTEQPAQGVQVFSPSVARDVRHMLNMVTMPGGTAPKAAAIGYSVGGKTGTAYKHEKGRGYADRKYRSVFVGLAPVSAPRIVVAVMVDEPTEAGHYGGDVAAPVFSQVVQQTLYHMGVAPDQTVSRQIVAKAQAAAPVPEVN